MTDGTVSAERQVWHSAHTRDMLLERQTLFKKDTTNMEETERKRGIYSTTSGMEISFRVLVDKRYGTLSIERERVQILDTTTASFCRSSNKILVALDPWLSACLFH